MEYLKTILRFCFLSWLLVVVPHVARSEETSADRQSQRIRQIVLSRGDDPAGLAHLIQLTKEMEAPAAAQLFRQLADDYLRAGKYQQAGGVLQQLATQFSEQPAAAEGLIALVQIYSSSEVAHTQRILTSASADEKSLSTYALYLAEQAFLKRRDLADNRALAFQCAVAARRSGNAKSAQRWLTPLKHHGRSQPWNHRALTESWLLSPRKEACPKPTLVCPRTRERPHLDGVLDEAIWKTESIAQLTSLNQDSSSSTQIRLAHDAEFLYLALQCTKFAGVTYLPDNTPRVHDADLSEQDHVQIQLDFDRDYASSFQLAVDHRGQTADRCWQDAGWNLRWFVAAGQDDSCWTIEAAIAWQELVRKPPAGDDAWALSVERRLPGADAQTWPAASAVDRFGLLLFE